MTERAVLPVTTVAVLVAASALAALLIGRVLTGAGEPAPSAPSHPAGSSATQPQFASSALPATIARLNAERIAGRRALVAATRAAAQAAAAEQLARAHRRAAAPLPGTAPATRRLAAAADAYAALASAARARAPSRYRAASRAVARADRRLRRTLTTPAAAPPAARPAILREARAAPPGTTAGSFLLLGLLGLCALFLAARETLGVLER